MATPVATARFDDLDRRHRHLAFLLVGLVIALLVAGLAVTLALSVRTQANTRHQLRILRSYSDPNGAIVRRQNQVLRCAFNRVDFDTGRAPLNPACAFLDR